MEKEPNSTSLGSSIREVSRHTFIYGVGVLSRLSAFILLPLHTVYLTKHDYGIVVLALSFIGVVAVFANYGMNVSFLRWYVPEEDPSERKRIFSTCYIGIIVVSVPLSLLIFLSATRLSTVILGEPSYYYLFYVAGVIILTDALFHLPQILLQAEKRPLYYIWVVFVNVTVSLVMNWYWVVLKGEGIKGVLYAALTASAAAFLFTIGVVIKNFVLSFSWEHYKEYVRFGSPYVFNWLFIVLIDLSDRFLLGKFMDAEMVALYSANYKLGSAMAVLVNAFRLAYHPFYLSMSKSPDAQRTFSRIFTYFLLVTCGVFLVLSLFINDLVRFNIGGYHLIAESYWSGTFIIPWILLSYIVMGSYVVFVPGIHIKKKTWYTPIFTGAGLLTNVLANIILIPRIGIFGAAVATLLAYGVMTVLEYFTVQRIYPIKYEFGRVFKLLLVTAIIFGIYQLRLQHAHFAYKFLLLALYPAGLFMLRFFMQAEWAEMKRILSRLMGRGGNA